MAEVEVLYFAALAERRGVDRERLQTSAASPAELYAELDGRHGLAFPQSSLRVAIDGAFVDWNSALSNGCEVVFVPPVSGG